MKLIGRLSTDLGVSRQRLLVFWAQCTFLGKWGKQAKVQLVANADSLPINSSPGAALLLLLPASIHNVFTLPVHVYKPCLMLGLFSLWFVNALQTMVCLWFTRGPTLEVVRTIER